MIIDNNQNKCLNGIIVLVTFSILFTVGYLGSIVYDQWQSGKLKTRVEQAMVQVNQYVNQTKDKEDTKEEKSNQFVIEEKNKEKEDISPKQQQGNVNKQATVTKEAVKVNKTQQKEKITIEVQTIDKTWYSIQIDGESKFKGIVNKGEVKRFSGKKIKLKIGNAAGVKVVKNNKVYGPFGKEGEVITKVFSASLNE
ncbi:hypothetical protein Halha_0743 [Halobacteroides halobius DSM 5150]|uniref:Cytoskeleton protein RodZ-like C-terminal domain-containing protein n=1 Tax=Halobacteroides halobius (strain ATCC 35273 / DSM 5150 / MD-1) TaxID=748449 RepID=L0K6R1_HALHC|nr:DUF4115 domain-containing protein [Halobacteroides halobius]AGB40716.1 hypothetical protein Halha_0743 [Halobacteroides halobius DSM 5150]